MKKINRMMFSLLAIVLMLGVFTPMIVFASDITVIIDGEPITFPDQGPVIVDGRTLVPVREVFETLRFTVIWNEETQIVNMFGARGTLSIAIGSATFFAVSPGESIATHELDVPAQIIGGRTLLPIRALLESIGYGVEWDSATSTISITSPAIDDAPAATVRDRGNLTPEEAEIVHWITATAAILNYENHFTHHMIGRPGLFADPFTQSGLRSTLERQWNITDADGIRQQVATLSERISDNMHLFSGFAVCGLCGQPMTVKTTTKTTKKSGKTNKYSRLIPK